MVIIVIILLDLRFLLFFGRGMSQKLIVDLILDFHFFLYFDKFFGFTERGRLYKAGSHRILYQ